MLDIAVAYNRYKFLGHEFLTWLWFVTEKDRERFLRIAPDLSSVTVGNRVVLENRMLNAVESIIIKGDDAGFEEGYLALRKGAVVVELNLEVDSGEKKWRLTLKGESFHLTNLKAPETGVLETREEMEGAVLEKIYLYDQIIKWMDALFFHFLKIRLSEAWGETELPQMKLWIGG